MTGGTVVVLGTTGRNFGAGFSGGNAYVLDLDKSKVNPASVADGSLLFMPLDDETEPVVRNLVRKHADETDSPVAKALIDDWENARTRFTRIVPKQFIAMTKAMAEAEEDGVDFNAPGAWDKVYETVMEGAR